MGRKTRRSRLRYIIIPLIFILLGTGLYMTVGTHIKDTLVARISQAIVLGAPEYSYSEVVSSDKTSGTIMLSDISLPGIGSQYAVMSCQRIDLKAPVYYGDTKKIFDNGVGQYVQSGIPGEGKTILIGGHDMTFFAPLENVKKGDIIKVQTLYGIFKYKVRSTDVRTAGSFKFDEINDDKEELVLYTCYPFGDVFGSDEQRFFVYCDKINGPVIDGGSR